MRVLCRPTGFRNATGGLRCLPYVSIIGVSKCGTTDLYHKLMQLGPFVETLNKVCKHMRACLQGVP